MFFGVVFPDYKFTCQNDLSKGWLIYSKYFPFDSVLNSEEGNKEDEVNVFGHKECSQSLMYTVLQKCHPWALGKTEKPNHDDRKIKI